MISYRRSIALLACTVLATPALAQTQATVSDDQVLCQVAPETPSCTGSVTESGASQDVSGAQKAMRLANVSSASVAAPAATARPAAPNLRAAPASPSQGIIRLAPTSRASGRMRLTTTPGYAPGKPRAVAAAPANNRDMVVTFKTGSASLTPVALENLRVYARVLNRAELSSRSYVIEGHTDAKGDAAANMTLSERRAQSVVATLVANGVSATRLEARGLGETRLRLPRRPNDGANRRVELIPGK